MCSVCTTFIGMLHKGFFHISNHTLQMAVSEVMINHYGDSQL